MSVLINMKMPRDCVNCPAFEEVFDAKCRITGKSVDGHWSCILQNDVYPRPDWCPLIEVPPHGDLIDRDALMLRINIHGTNKFGILDEDIRQFVNAAPTIIPSEEGE